MPAVGVTDSEIDAELRRSRDGGQRDGGTADSGAQCAAEQRLALNAQVYDGRVAALYVPVTWTGRTSLMHLDSAGWVSVLITAGDGGWVDRAGTVTLGCSARSLPGYGALAPFAPVDGLDVVGTLGADFLRAQPTLVDVEARRLTLWPANAVVQGVELETQLVQGVYLVRATFDGAPVRLLLDTGSSDSLWLGVAKQPGDVTIDTFDSLGKPLRVYRGTVNLGLGGVSKQVPVFHAPSFALLIDLQAQLGVHLDGLIGLSSLRTLFVGADGGVRITR